MASAQSVFDLAVSASRVEEVFFAPLLPGLGCCLVLRLPRRLKVYGVGPRSMQHGWSADGLARNSQDEILQFLCETDLNASPLRVAVLPGPPPGCVSTDSVSSLAGTAESSDGSPAACQPSLNACTCSSCRGSGAACVCGSCQGAFLLVLFEDYRLCVVAYEAELGCLKTVSQHSFGSLRPLASPTLSLFFHSPTLRLVPPELQRGGGSCSLAKNEEEPCVPLTQPSADFAKAFAHVAVFEIGDGFWQGAAGGSLRQGAAAAGKAGGGGVEVLVAFSVDPFHVVVLKFRLHGGSASWSRPRSKSAGGEAESRERERENLASAAGEALLQSEGCSANPGLCVPPLSFLRSAANRHGAESDARVGDGGISAGESRAASVWGDHWVFEPSLLGVQSCWHISLLHDLPLPPHVQAEAQRTAADARRSWSSRETSGKKASPADVEDEVATAVSLGAGGVPSVLLDLKAVSACRLGVRLALLLQRGALQLGALTTAGTGLGSVSALLLSVHPETRDVNVIACVRRLSPVSKRGPRLPARRTRLLSCCALVWCLRLQIPQLLQDTFALVPLPLCAGGGLLALSNDAVACLRFGGGWAGGGCLDTSGEAAERPWPVLGFAQVLSPGGLVRKDLKLLPAVVVDCSSLNLSLRGGSFLVLDSRCLLFVGRDGKSAMAHLVRASPLRRGRESDGDRSICR